MSYSKNDDEATIANVPKRTKGNNYMYFQNENFQMKILKRRIILIEIKQR